MSTDVGRTLSDTSPVTFDGDDDEDLLPLALSQPAEARARAQALLLGSLSSRQTSIAHQCLAIVTRDGGHLDVALQHLRAALAAARQSGEARTAEVLATFGLTLVQAGRTAEGLKRFEQARRLTVGAAIPRLLLREGLALYLIGRLPESLVLMNEAIDGSRRAGDVLWEARGLNNRCAIRLAMGDAELAEADAVAAAPLLASVGQVLESVHSAHDRAHAALLKGDLPGALALMDEVADRYRELDAQNPDLVLDHAQALLIAGLAGEARSRTQEALVTSDLQPVKRAEIILTAAQAALATGDLGTAHRDAQHAARLFTAQLRPRWALRAKLLALQTEYLILNADIESWKGTASGSLPRSSALTRRRRHLLRGSAQIVTALQGERTPDLAVAQLLHGRIAQAVGRVDLAQESFEQSARSRHRGSGLARSAGWLAAALLAQLRGDRRALLHACRRGLEAVDEHRALMGDLELRALATHHGNELATMAFRSVAAQGDARGMMWWVERWRATGLSATPVRPKMDATLERDLTALRDVTRRLDSVPEDDPRAPLLRQERSRREAAVRSAYRRQSGRGETSQGFDLKSVFDALGDHQLIALIQDKQLLYSLVMRKGVVRRRAPLSTEEALREAQFARFALRRAAYGRTPDLAAVGRRLEHALLGATSDLADRVPTIVVPPSTLLTAPWGLLPIFAGATLTVSPSATLWMAARGQPRLEGHIALVSGPGLSTGETEVTTLSPLYSQARSIGGEGATVAEVLKALDGARLAHIAAHGTFRADAPLFSSLTLADGPLTMHDLERLEQPPAEIVLSACDSGDAAPIGANEALGLVSSLLAMGTATVLASVVPVNDRATIGVMRRVHDAVGGGGSLAQGWLSARQATSDPIEQATAAAFTAWGA